MNFKKVLAGVLTSAMVAAFTISVGATDIYSPDGNWYSNNEFLSNNDFEGADLTGLTHVIFNASCTDLNWGWNNGQFNSNSNAEAEGSGWQQVSFGGTESNADVTLTETGDFTIEVPLVIGTDGWFNLGWGTGCAKDIFSINSIDFYAGNDLLGTWTETDGYVAASHAVDGIQKITLAEAEAMDSYTITISNGTDSEEIVSTKYYTSVSVGDITYEAEEGYVYIGTVITDIPAGVTVTVSID